MPKQPEGKLAAVSGARTDINPQEHYDAWSADYDADLIHTYGYVAPRIAVEAFLTAAPDRQATIIDLGCGTGLVGRKLASNGYTRIDGLDISPGMLSQARRLGIYRQLLPGNLTKRTSIPDASYDALICVGAFGGGHVGPDNLRELIRVVKPGAPMVIYMNALPYEERDYPRRFRDLQSAGFWEVEKIESSNYMDALERPGRLIIAKRTGSRPIVV
ncbi:class I SAM-dependent methyltransferase [Pelagibius sp. Alg239-R121]|uniref:class I SAM-dependent DNA methyltransferase n=1 Tax=Pelagibius sp. Alg239-R121 TaxID=2993448 RepID=UPI0024A6BF7C|nr:class I SAM-dependent methyltransferase [Pelagibius sp. Alg239-R121]